MTGPCYILNTTYSILHTTHYIYTLHTTHYIYTLHLDHYIYMPTYETSQ